MENGMNRSERPRARTAGLVIQELEGETLVYDEDRHQAHCLNGPSAAVWRACDGTRTMTEVAALLGDQYPGADEDTASYALQQLAERHLLDESSESLGGRTPESPEPRRVTRREMVRKAAMSGLAVGLAIPVVKSIVAPTPAHAFSCIPSGHPCSSSAQCCSGLCLGGQCI